MSNRKNLLDRLNTLVTKVGDTHKTAAAAVKTASPGDGAEDGTKAVETGAQMASNKSEAAKGTKAMVDGGAKTNPAGASLDMSTDGATAVATDGQKGTEGADLEIKAQAANGPEGGIKGDDKTAALVADLRKVASELETSEKASSSTAKAEAKLAQILSKKAEAPRTLTALEQFLVKQARSNAKVKIAADMPDQAVADQSSNGLMEAIQSGQLSEEDAEKILLEAVQSGAISEEELAQAMQEMHGAGAGAQGAPAAGLPAEAGAAAAAPLGDGAAPAPAMGGDPAAAGGEMVEDPGLEAKMAAVNIGPGHDLYLQKIATLNKDAFDAGYDYAVKLAEAMLGDNVEDGTKDAEGGIEAPKVEKAVLKPAEGEAVGTKDQIENNGQKDIPAASTKKAEALPPEAMGAGAPPAADPMAAAGGAPTDPAAAMSDPSSVLNPKSPEEAAALQQVLQEMGLSMEDLQALMAQKSGQPSADPAAAKMAAARVATRIEILSKVAALQETAAAK